MKPIIRKAEKSDMPAVLELIKELAAFEKEPEAVIITEEDLKHDGFGENPSFLCFVAEMDGGVHGMALIYFRYSTWKGKTIHLEDLVVREAYRKKGLGKALFERVIQYAGEQGVRRTEWVVLDWNKNAIEFYKRSGATILTDWYLAQMDEAAIKDYLT
ncbi:MAG TPA: GNAT family N-acetyltransferase [Salinimicrobium sp.]|nr:GNAT family N-acetyltransferase [Salinimicrobium sp.]